MPIAKKQVSEVSEERTSDVRIIAVDDNRTVDSACHSIIDAASGLALDIQFIALSPEGAEKDSAMADTRSNLETIVRLARWIRMTAVASLLCCLAACGGASPQDWNIQPTPPAPLTADCLMVTEGVCGTGATERPRWDCPNDEFDAATTTYTWGVHEGSCESLGVGTRGPAWTTWCCAPGSGASTATAE